jgi:gamma-glutamylcyclotransferase (GGCT)/AIG2-like uncharacterized protein YtfP
MVLTIDAEALKITDFIEGYRPDHEQSLYVREKVEVDLGDGDIVNAWTYFFAAPDHIHDRPRLLVRGDDDLPVYSWPAE